MNLLKRLARWILRQELDEAQHERWGDEMTIEYYRELVWEGNAALAGLAQEAIKPCSGECPGHLGPEGMKLHKEGLRRYEALVESA